MRKASIICSILLSLFFLTEPVNAQSINLTPKWTAQAQFAGYYVADKLGFYKEEGLDVHVVHPSLSASSFSFLPYILPHTGGFPAAVSLRPAPFSAGKLTSEGKRTNIQTDRA